MKLLFSHAEDVPFGQEADAIGKGYSMIATEIPRRTTPEMILSTQVRLERFGDKSILTVRIYDQNAVDWTWVIIRGLAFAVLLIFLFHHYG